MGEELGSARRDRLAPALPGSRTGHSHHRRSDRGTPGDSASPPTTSSPRRYDGPGCTRSSGSPSVCWPVSGLWECRAMSAPTRTLSSCEPVTSDDAMTADWARTSVRGVGTDLRAGLSTRWMASIELPTTFPRNHLPPSSGSNRPGVVPVPGPSAAVQPFPAARAFSSGRRTLTPAHHRTPSRAGGTNGGRPVSGNG